MMRKLLYIDLFCGAGGTSTGVESATLDGQKCAHVIACVNHDPHAIASHLANHPEATHLNRRNISACCAGKRNRCGRFRWFFFDDENWTRLIKK